MTARTTARPGSPVPALGGLLIVGPALAAGVALVLVKWLLVTVALLAVPFVAWWLIDRARRRAATASTPSIPRPRLPRAAPAPAPAGSAVGAVPTARQPVLAGPSRPFLAPDRTVPVVGDEAYQLTLARQHRERPVTRVTAELRPSPTAPGPRHGARTVEVFLDGERVGELTTTASARYRHHVETAADLPPACLATIAHGEDGYQIDLRLPRS